MQRDREIQINGADNWKAWDPNNRLCRIADEKTMSVKSLWADAVARGGWDMACDQCAMPSKLKWPVWTVCATQTEASEAVWGVHWKRMEDESAGSSRLWPAFIDFLHFVTMKHFGFARVFMKIWSCAALRHVSDSTAAVFELIFDSSDVVRMVSARMKAEQAQEVARKAAADAEVAMSTARQYSPAHSQPGAPFTCSYLPGAPKRPYTQRRCQNGKMGWTQSQLSQGAVSSGWGVQFFKSFFCLALNE